MIDPRTTTADDVDRLWRERPRSRFVRASLALFVLLLVVCWWRLGADLRDAFSPGGLDALGAFFTEDAKPRPLRDEPWSWDATWAWIGGEMSARGWAATANTLGVSVLAIVLAAILGGFLSLPAARTLATAEPFLPGGRPPSPRRRGAWRAVVGLTRVGLVMMRSMPEYVMAFLLLTIVGRSAWPAVLALMIHNAGILGRLYGEVIENLPARTLTSLRAAGAGRLQIVTHGILPAALPRFLMYFFYRWETCVREATVLSMLGMAGLGYWILEADAHDREDKLLLYIALASMLVLVGDLLSAVARRIVRRAS